MFLSVPLFTRPAQTCRPPLTGSILGLNRLTPLRSHHLGVFRSKRRRRWTTWRRGGDGNGRYLAIFPHRPSCTVFLVLGVMDCNVATATLSRSATVGVKRPASGDLSTFTSARAAAGYAPHGSRPCAPPDAVLVVSRDGSEVPAAVGMRVQVGLLDAGVVHALLPGAQLLVVSDAEAERARPAAAAPTLICADKVCITACAAALA